MGEAIRTDRAAEAGKFRVWGKDSGGEDHPILEEFDTLDQAWAVGEHFAKTARGENVVTVLVYDDRGQVRHRWDSPG